MDKNRKLKWDKAIKGREITTTYGENYTAGDDTKGLFQQMDNGSWTPVSVEQARDIYVPNVTDPVSNSYTQLGPMPTLTVTSPDWKTSPYSVYDTRFGGMTPITTINVRKNKNTGEILPEDYREVLAIKDWYAKQHPKSDPSENFINDLVFTAATLGANKNAEAATKGISSLFSNIDPIVKTSFREGIAKPMLLGSLVDQTQKAVTGTSLSDQIGSWLTNDYGWNPYVAHFVGDLTNPGYTMSGNAGNLLNKSINSFIKGTTNLKDFGINNGRKLINRWNHPGYEILTTEQALKEAPKGRLDAEWLNKPIAEREAIINDYVKSYYENNVHDRLLSYSPAYIQQEVPENIFYNRNFISLYDGPRIKLFGNQPIQYTYNLPRQYIGIHYADTGENFMQGNIFREKPTYIPSPLIRFLPRRFTNKYVHYIAPSKQNDLTVGIHEVVGHGTEPFMPRRLGKAYDLLQYRNDYRFRFPKAIEDGEVWATLEEMRAQIPNYKNLSYEQFINELKRNSINSGYAQDYLKGFNEEGLKKLYDLFINPQQIPTRKPLSFAERMGIPKGDRGNLSIDQKQALEDLEQYMTSR